MQNTRLIKRSMTIGGHRSSLALEAAFWDELEKVAAWEGVSAPVWVARVVKKKPAAQSAASAVRVAILEARSS